MAKTVFDTGEEAFGRLDKDGSGTVDTPELTSMFMRSGLYLDTQGMESAFDALDKDRSGTVALDEFMQWLRSDDPFASKLLQYFQNEPDEDGEQAQDDDPIHAAKVKLRALSSSKGGMNWSKLFQHYDRDGGGTLNFREFKAAFRRDAGITPEQMDADQLQELFDYIDIDNSKEIEMDEFMTWLDEDDEDEEAGVEGVGSYVEDPTTPDHDVIIELPSTTSAPIQVVVQDSQLKRLVEHNAFLQFFTAMIFLNTIVSTRNLGRRTAPFPSFRIPYRVPHKFAPRS